MSFRLLSLSSLYKGYLDSFYDRYPDIYSKSYSDHLQLLLSDTTEFTGSYLRNFRKLGIEAECIIANDIELQKKWGAEHGITANNHKNILFNQIVQSAPDVLWIEDLNYISPEWIIEVRQQVKNLRLIIAYHCAPFNKKVLDNLREVDFVVTCTPGLKSYTETLGMKSFLVYHAFDADLLSRLDIEDAKFEHDFIFSGSLISGGDFHSSRIKLIEKLLEGNIDIELFVNLEKEYKIRAKQSVYLFSELLRRLKMENLMVNKKMSAYGKTWVDTYSQSILKRKHSPVYGIDMFNLFKLSRIVLNFHIGVAGNYAGNMRMFEVTGVGSCLLTDNKKNLPDLFIPDVEVVVYDNAEDCVSKVKWLLDHEEERIKIAYAGHIRTLTSHTVEKRCVSLIEIITQELKQKN